MFFKKIKFILILCLFYQTPSYSKSNSLKNFEFKNLSKYFSGIVAFENEDNSTALNFYGSSKILINQHEPFLKKYISSLILEKKIPQAINLIKQNIGKNNSNFFDAYLLLIIDSLKRDNLNQANNYLSDALIFVENDGFKIAILESLKQYIFVFTENKILDEKKNFGKLSIISETFQRCYLDDPKTDDYFLDLINDDKADYTRYLYFYLSYLIDKKRLNEVKKILKDIDYIQTTLLLSQGKSWIENGNKKKLNQVFNCRNHNDVISEFLFLISNLYSSQDNFKRSNIYLNLSNFLNPKFIFNLSLAAENYYENNQFEKVKALLKHFKKEDDFYYWYRIKKEAQIIAKQRDKKESLNYITSEFDKIHNPNNKILFDIANFYKNSKKYKDAIRYYSKVINNENLDLETKSDLLYRRGGSYERIGEYEKADKDLFHSLEIRPNDAYVLNYLAYSWLERNYRIQEAIEMLEKAYASKSNDPYIIDSIGWAYFLIDDYIKAESYLKRAVELMPNDPIVNDHYGDILWKLGYKIQARYFWKSVLKMSNADEEMIKNISIKILDGLKSS